MVAVGIGTGVASLAGSAISASAAGSAADKQAQAAKEANDLQWKMYQQNRSDQDPYRQAGINALYGTGGVFRKKAGYDPAQAKAAQEAKKNQFFQSRLAQGAAERENAVGKMWDIGDAREQVRAKLNQDAMAQIEKEWADSADSKASNYEQDQYEIDPEFTRNFTNEDFVKDPGYEFRMAEGQKALERSAAARGGLQSGGTLKALGRYGQDYASNEYSNAYNRFNADRDRRFNRLSSLAGGGQTASQNVGNAAQAYGQNAGNNMMGAANAAGAAGIASANAWGTTLSGLGKNWMDMTLDRQQSGGITGKTGAGASTKYGQYLTP